MYSKITLVGNLGQDPEMRYLPTGQAVTNLSVACNRRWTDKASGQTQEETTWFRVAVWGAPAEAANQYLTKGRQVLVEGRLRPDPATGGPRLFTRNDGTAGAAYEVVADRVQFLGGNPNGGDPATGPTAAAPANGHARSAAQPTYAEDDIPF